MLSGVMEHFGLNKNLNPVAYYDSEYHQQVFKDLKAAIHEGGIVAFTGVVGSGKTLLLSRMQRHLREEGRIEVCESLVFDVQRVTLNTLKLALYYDLATEKDGDITGKPEKSERALMKVMQRCQKPICLFIDDAHDVHGQTLRSLKQLIEKTGRRGKRPGRGPRSLEFEGIQGQQRRYITWLLEQCAPAVDPLDILPPRCPRRVGRAAQHTVADRTLCDPDPRTGLPLGGKACHASDRRADTRTGYA